MRSDIGGLAAEMRECRPAERLNGTRNLLPGSDSDNTDLFSGAVVPASFTDVREAARTILKAAWNRETQLTPKGASFTGQASVATEPLTARQREWLGQLLSRAGLPPLAEGAGQ
jgi:hypothetical protein